MHVRVQIAERPRLRPAPAPEGIRLVQRYRPEQAGVRQELLQGLAQPQACIAAKHLYDCLGSHLFEAITELPEYYLTRTEQALFDRHAPEMARLLPAGMTLVDLGAGNCRKAARLLPVFKPERYVAVDISSGFLDQALRAVQAQHPHLSMLGLGMDFSQHLVLEAGEVPDPRVLFYPGSSIGNFRPQDALAFLRQARQQCEGGGLLIGVDLIKPAEVLLPAYDDALRVTSAFNRNILRHVNRLLGSDFELSDWRHFAFFNEEDRCIEMHLQALRSAQVQWPGGGRRFAAGERILTEQSYKWELGDFIDLLGHAGFARTRSWTDDRGWYALVWADATP